MAKPTVIIRDPQPAGRRTRWGERTGPLRRRLGTFSAIAVGGALGAPARVELGRMVPAGPGLPWGTLVVNVVGSFLLGAVATLLVERAAPTRYLGPLVATGLCGAFTTFSTFAVEVDLRIRSGDIAVALAYVVTSALLGLAAVAGGIGLTLGLLRREGVICASESSARSR